MRRLTFLREPLQKHKQRDIRRSVEEEWFFWRPIVEKMASYDTMERLDLDEIMAFNTAIDIQIEKIERQRKEAERNK